MPINKCKTKQKPNPPPHLKMYSKQGPLSLGEVET